MCTIKKANSTVNVALARFLWLKIEENCEFRLFRSIGTIDILFRYRKQKVTVENFRFFFPLLPYLMQDWTFVQECYLDLFNFKPTISSIRDTDFYTNCKLHLSIRRSCS